MFDFEKLEVYQVARELNKTVLKFLFSNNDIVPLIKDRWEKSSMGIVLHLAEGVSQMIDTDKKHYFTLARSSVYECVTLLHLVSDLGQIELKMQDEFYARYEQLSKMLLGMYRSKA